MKKLFVVFLFVFLVIGANSVAYATNGDNMISIGPVANAMGGVGIAAPQDAISAVFSNPAAMCFGPYCPGSEFNFAGTVFMPDTHTEVTIDMGPMGVYKTSGKSASDLYLIPAIGISTPITSNLRFGLAAFGVSGLGVDYRDEIDLDPSTPGHQDVYTNLQIMKFAPNIAYMVTPDFSIGAALHINYGALDLGDGTSAGLGWGAQLGAIYKTGPVSIGAVYISPQVVNHKNVSNFDAMLGSLTKDDLKLESPQTIGVGVALEAVPKVFLVEADVKWLNWGGADGYSDFQWEDQWIFAIGAQYKPIPDLALRAGFNYGKNPIKDNDGWDGSTLKTVQGKRVPRFQYEVLRITGFPGIVESHITAGLSYNISKSVSLNLGYMHAFHKDIKEKGYLSSMGNAPVTVESELSEDSIDFGITWRF